MAQRKVYNKLIRDRIPEIIRAQGRLPAYRVLKADEFRDALKLKLMEEAHELLKAEDPAAVINEVCDVMEVLEAVCAEYGLNADDISETKINKKKDRGGFAKRLFLEYVE